MMQACEIVPMMEQHWERSAKSIYRGIATGNATFEKSAPAVEGMGRTASAIMQTGGALGDDVLGWAALSRVSSRCVYGGVAEVSVYVAEAARGRGIGR